MRVKQKSLKVGQEFSTKDDAFAYVSGRKMSNRMMLTEATEKHNVLFLQRGKAYYTNKSKEKVEVGENRVFADRIESRRTHAKPFRIDLNKPCLVFVKELKRGNAALAYYRFHGEFNVNCVKSLSTPNDYVEFAKIGDVVNVKA